MPANEFEQRVYRAERYFFSGIRFFFFGIFLGTYGESVIGNVEAIGPRMLNGTGRLLTGFPSIVATALIATGPRPSTLAGILNRAFAPV